MAIFFFNDTATTEIYTLSLHDALPIFRREALDVQRPGRPGRDVPLHGGQQRLGPAAVHERVRLRGAERSEEHTSELQSRQYLVCRLLLEKKKALSTTVFNTSLITPSTS